MNAAVTEAERPLARFGYRMLFACCRHMPYRLGYLLAWMAGWIGWWCDARGRKQVATNLRPLLEHPAPEALPRMVRRNYISFTVTVVEHLRMAWIDPVWLTAPKLQVVDPWGLREQPPTGAAVLTGVHTNWELYVRWFQLHGFTPRLAGIALSHGDAGIDALFDAVREQLGLTPLRLDRAPLASLRWLREGGQLAIVGDRVYQGHGIPVRIGYSRLSLPVGPAALAVQSGAPVVVFHLARRGPTELTLFIGRPLHAQPDLPRDDQVRLLTEEIATWFDRYLRASPHQWAAFMPVWHHDPRCCPDQDA
ncbi:MAG: lysophospholipid acyltransferase family protein [Planctomycetota bacterium]